MHTVNRRDFLRWSAAGAAALAGGWTAQPANSLWAQEPGQRPSQAEGVKVLNPRARVPVSLIIDDSTCLVNLAHFCIPQFAEVFPDRYRQDWRRLPREIPDAFVRKFFEWCHEHGVRGKYSIVPYPACVGWIDREMPGWPRRELQDSLQLVRDLVVPAWDIHPEMVTHTWVIDTKTGRPYEERSERFMENWGWSVGRSVDELTDYLAYALKLLHNAGLPCEGVTTPGGFGSRARPQLAQATFEACRDVYGTEIPHYFRDLFTGDESVAPQVYYARDLDTDDPKCVVSIIGCTGDWFGGWDGLEAGSVDRFITEDLRGGRLPEVIARGEPAVMVCHWPGIYFNGEEVGFKIFQQIVHRLNAAYDNLVWMTNGEIARYWAARTLTAISANTGRIELSAPYACPAFTLRCMATGPAPPAVAGRPLKQVDRLLALVPGTFFRQGQEVTVCFDLAKGVNRLSV